MQPYHNHHYGRGHADFGRGTFDRSFLFNRNGDNLYRADKRITNGYKSKLFVLQLSFIGWMLLAPLTLGLLFIWLAPNMNAATANFYLAIKGDAQSPHRKEADYETNCLTIFVIGTYSVPCCLRK